MVYRRILSVIPFFFAAGAVVHAQYLTGTDPELQWRYARRAYAAPNMHTEIQPWNIADISAEDSVQTNHSKKFQYFVYPLVNLQLAGGSSFKQRYEAGVHAGLSVGKSLFVDFNYTLADQQFYGADRMYIDSTGLIPHYDRYLSKQNDFFLYQSLNFSVSWTPIKYITLRVGKDRQFWGDGYRSLFLSDNAGGYPFLQTVFEFWHIKYTFMTCRMSDYQLNEHFETRHKKYTSMHTLSWNITPNININLFEAVIWDAVDSVSRRTFDINYLNPVIVLRPVEFAIGSPDNVIVGFGGKFKIWRENYLYGQFVLDEFKLDELKARTGWWANKYAFQVGVRSFAGDRRPLMIQAEVNQVRPYTDTHTYPLQNYGHLVDALAHPMGANLREGLAIIRWAFAPDWSVHATMTYAVQGTDSAGVNLGANIYKSNTTRTKQYGNTMLQGVRAITSYQELKVARMLVPKWNLQAEAVVSNQFFKREEETVNNFYFGIGLKTLLYRH